MGKGQKQKTKKLPKNQSEARRRTLRQEFRGLCGLQKAPHLGMRNHLKQSFQRFERKKL
jgi:hypothetical protein